MHRTVTALAAAAILASYAAPAIAQETTDQPPATSPNRTATSGVVPQAGQPTYNDLMAALGRTSSTVAQLRSMPGLTTNNLKVVNVQGIVPPSNTAAFNAAVAQNQSQLATLRRMLANTRVTASTDNSTITIGQFLTDNKLSVNRVVAAGISGNSVTLFIQ